MHLNSLYFTLVTVLLLAQACESFMEITKEPMQEFKYEDLLDLALNLREFQEFIKVHNLKNTYPEVLEADCKKEVCNHFLFEVTNFGRGKTENEMMPTVLVVAGLDGQHFLGINTLYHFMRSVPQMYEKDESWFRIFNNIRLMIMPLANPSAFVHGDSFERTMLGGQNQKIDPLFDFNWKNKGQCFQSSTSNYLYNVTRDNLIAATLILSEGNNKILYPIEASAKDVSSPPPDKSMLEAIANLIASAANNDHHHEKKIYSQYTVDNMSADKTFEANKGAGSFLMWSYASTSFPRLVESLCFAKNVNFTKDYKVPENMMTRSLTLQIDLDKKKTLKGSDLGNQISFISPSSPDAKFGLVSRTIHMLQQFLEITRPFLVVSEISLRNGSEVVVSLTVKGCLKVSDFKVTYPAGIKYRLESTYEGIRSITRRQEFEILLDLKELQGQPSAKARYLGFDLFCDSEFHQEDKNITLFAELKLKKYKIVTYKDFTLKNSHFVGSTLLNFDVSQLPLGPESDHDFMFNSKKYNQLTVLTQPSLAIQIGPFFPIILKFDKTTKAVTIHLRPDNLPSPETLAAIQSDSTEILELGIGNRLEELKSSVYLIKNLMKLKDNWGKVSVNISKTKPWKNMLGRKGIETIDRIKVDGKLRTAKDIMDNCANKEAQTFDFYTLKIFSDLAVHMSQDSFLSLVDDIAHVKMLGNLGPVVKKKLSAMKNLQNVFNSANMFRLSGRIVIYDESLVSREYEEGSSGMVRDREYQRLDPLPGIYLRFRELICTSLNMTLIKASSVNQSVGKIKDLKLSPSLTSYIKNNKDYYGIKIFKDPEDSKMGVINLFVSAEPMFPHYILRHKSKVIKLSDSKRKMKVEMVGVEHSFYLYIYEYKAPIVQFDFGGRLIRLYEPSEKEILFDCFLQSQSGYLDTSNSFKLHRRALITLVNHQKVHQDDLTVLDSQNFSKLVGNRDSRVLGASILCVWAVFVSTILLVIV